MQVKRPSMGRFPLWVGGVLLILVGALFFGCYVVYSLFSLRRDVALNVQGMQSVQSIPFRLESEDARTEAGIIAAELDEAGRFLASLPISAESWVEYREAQARFEAAARESIVNLTREISAEGKAQSLNRLHMAAGLLSTRIRAENARLSGRMARYLDQVSFLLILLFVLSSMNIGLHILLQRHRNRLVEMQEELKEKATRDVLTGRWNRRAIQDILGSELARAKRSTSTMGVIIVDLDHFKVVNDRFGHQAGDRVLKAVSECMANQLRPYDELGRYGGEEFLVVTPGCSYEHAMMIGERLRRAVENLDIVLAGTRHSVTISVGVAMCDGRAANIDGIIERADKAMYTAKNQGRNRVVGELDRYSDTA
jgi:diguanylate cyclase (GGDEF)-like protein